MNILGIETSCDETSAAVFGDEGLLSNIVASQTIHHQFGGVVPELASRAHIQLIIPIVKNALLDAHLSGAQLDGIAVTYGPGLVGSILVGLNFAKAMAYTYRIPWIGVNHIEGHIFANFVNKTSLQCPFIVLIVSGGHTQLIYVKELGNYHILGKTRDDAAGEAFDKVAKMMNLGYPGGPIIDRLARGADENYIDFPRPMLNDDSNDFSFSGMKTAVLYYLKKIDHSELENHRNDIVASFQSAIVDVLVEKTLRAAKKKAVKDIVLAGGVASNSQLRERFKNRAEQEGMRVNIPSSLLCTDNAAMIACAGFYKIKKGEISSYDLSPKPSMNL